MVCSVPFFSIVQALYNVTMGSIGLYNVTMGSIGMDLVISDMCYKGTILQRNQTKNDL